MADLNCNHATAGGRQVREGPAPECPLCGREVHRAGETHPDFGDTQILRCDTCDFWFGHPAPGAEELARYYETVFGARRQWSKDPAFLAIMERRATAQIAFVGDHLAGVRTALDIGCGVGALVAELTRAGIQAVGFDSDETVVQIGRTRWGANLQRGHVDANTAGPPVDLLCLSHVVEHFADPVGELGRLAARVRPGGFVFIEVPRCTPWMFAQGVDSESHLGFFSHRSLHILAQRTGLDPLRLASCGPPIETFYWNRVARAELRSGARRIVAGLRTRWSRGLARLDSRRWPIPTEFDGYYDAYDAGGVEQGIWLRALLRRPPAPA